MFEAKEKQLDETASRGSDTRQEVQRLSIEAEV